MVEADRARDVVEGAQHSGDVAQRQGRAARARTSAAAARPRSPAAPTRGRAPAAPARGGSRRGCAGAAASRPRERGRTRPRSRRVARRSRAPRRSRSPDGVATSPRWRRGPRAASRGWGTAPRATGARRRWRRPGRARARGSPRRARRRAAPRATRPRRRGGTPARRPASPSRSRAVVDRSGHTPSTEPIGVRNVRRSGIGERGLQLDVGVEARVQLAEHLADDRHRAVVGSVDQRGVGLLAREHGRPCARLSVATLRVGRPVATERGPLPCPPAVTRRQQRGACRRGRKDRR